MQTSSDMKTANTVCGICNAACGIQLTFHADKLIEVKGNKQHPGSHGYLCPKGKALVEMIYSPERIRQPLKKTADQRWQEISWTEALQLIAQKITAIKAESGPQALAIHVGQTGVKKQFTPYAERFARAYGTPNFSTAGSQCHLSRAMASTYTFGCHPQPDFANSQCIILWGSNPEISNPPSLKAINKSLKNGGKLIVIDPRRTALAEKADLHLRVCPGGDNALGLAFIKIILDNHWYDDTFVNTWTIGLAALQGLLQSYSLAELAVKAGVAADQIKAAAQLYAASGPACIAHGNAMELHRNGFQAARTISILQALTGNLDKKGGERFIPNFLAPFAIDKPHPVNVPAIGQEEYPLFFRYSGNAQANCYADAILYAKPYKIRGMIVAGSNPLLTWPDTNQVAKALSSLDFLVVMDQFMTATAKLADLVLPAASFLGSYELWEEIDEAGTFLTGLVEPLINEGDCRSNWWFWKSLATEMGYAENFHWTDESNALNARLQLKGLDLDELRKYPDGYPLGPWQEQKYLQQGFATPSGKVELYSAQIEAAGGPPLPCLLTSAEDLLPLENQDYPLLLTTGARTYGYMHSRFHNLPSLKKMDPEPILEIHPLTANNLGIADTERVNLISKQGCLQIKSKYNPDLAPNVLCMPHGWDEANANLLSAGMVLDLDPVTGFPADRSIPVRINRLTSASS